MAIVRSDPATDGQRRRIELFSPVDRGLLGQVEVDTKEEVAATVARARSAQPSWAAKPVAERAAVLSRAIDVLLARQREIVATVRAETGKPEAEALALEILQSADFLNYWCRRAPKDLGDQHRRIHGYLRPFKKLFLQHRPLGVVGVITPWNAPFVLSLNPTVQALLAGNAVVLKPSEATPRSAEWVATVLHEAGVPAEVLQLLHGDGETGAALVDGDVDKIAFTGSAASGRKIAASCAERFVPYTLELGGKDAMIVCADADLERAAAGAVYLSMFNTGQVCLSVERIYVVDGVADEFVELVKQKAAALTYGPGEGKDVGPFCWDRQLDVVNAQLEDAKAKGAKVCVGGKPVEGDGLHFQPTVVTDVTHDMALMTEETFGPIVAIMRVTDETEAVAKANDCSYGLGGSVFTKDAAKARRIARELDTGSVVHNDAAVIYGVPEAPFGGRKDSGVGHVNGIDGLLGFAHQQPVLIDRWQPKSERIWYPYADKTVKTLETTIKMAFGSRLMRRLMS